MSESIRIAVVGSGYVGLVAAVCFAEIGHSVVCVDNDEGKVAALASGDTLIHERHLPELLGKHRGSRIRFTTDLAEATRECEAIFIAVGTPQSENGDADLSYVEAVACEIARSITSYKVVVEKSTVPVYTNEWICRAMERNGVRRRLFDVVSNPEFLREGTAVQDFLHPDRIVIGADSEKAASLLDAIYAPLTTGAYYSRTGAVAGCCSTQKPPALLHTSTKSAEIILQCLSGAEDLLHQRGVEPVRGNGREHRAGGAWNWPGQPHRTPIPPTRDRLWGLVLPEGCCCVPVGGRAIGHRLQPVE